MEYLHDTQNESNKTRCLLYNTRRICANYGKEYGAKEKIPEKH